MKKQAVLTIYIFLILAAAHAQLEPYIGLVSAVPNRKAETFYGYLAEFLAEQWMGNCIDALNDYLETRFAGSGFVYVAPDGQNYVITSSSAVGNALEMEVEFRAQDGKIEKYGDLTVFAVNRTLGLALLAFPASQPQPFQQGLPLSEALPGDGQTIWAAGFTSETAPPHWQFDCGVITNAAARLPEAPDDTPAALIAYSVQAETGSWGSPLLIEDSHSPLNYAVAGVNIRQARGRQTLNYAVPAKTVREFIAAAFASQTNAGREAEIQKAADAFIAAASNSRDNYIKAAEYISYKYVYASGVKIFRDFIEIAPENIKNQVINSFLNISPLEAVRRAVAWQIVSQIKPDVLAYTEIDSITPASGNGFNVVIAYTLETTAIDYSRDKETKDGNFSLSFTMDAQAFKSLWRLEQGAWRIMGFSKISDRERSLLKKKLPGGLKKAAPVRIYSPYRFFINASYNLELPLTTWSHGFNLSAMHYGKTSPVGLGLFYEYDSIFTEKTDSRGVKTGELIHTRRNSFGALFGLRVPLDFGVVNFMPYVNNGFSVGVTDKTMTADYALNPGFYLGLGVKSKVNGLFGLSYKWRKNLLNSGDTEIPAKHLFTVSLVLAF